MLRKYVQKIVKSELQDKELEYFYNSLPDSNIVSQWEKEHEELKEKITHLKQDKAYSNERNKYLHLQLSQEKAKYSKQVKYTEEMCKKLSEQISELKNQLEEQSFKNGNLQFNTYGDKYAINTLQDENKKLKELIENLDAELTLKGNILSELKQEKTDILFLINKYLNDHTDFTTLYLLITKIKTILDKE